MENFSYCFSLTLIHSLWQAAILLLFYNSFNFLFKKNIPFVKRNILFFLLLTQLFISISTFLIYYSGTVSCFTGFWDNKIAPGFNFKSYMTVYASWILAVYLVLLLFKSTGLLINWNRFKARNKDYWIKPSIQHKLFTSVKSQEFGIRKKVSLWYSNAINTPITFGYLKPVILLPVALLNNLSIEETETLIIHELTHIKNNDYFLNWLLLVLETIFFFNPFIYFIGKQIRLEREKNCDMHVLQFDYQAISYAETLLKAAIIRSAPAPFFLPAVVQNRQLLQRIRFFTQEPNLRFYKRNHTGLACSLLALIFLFNFFILHGIQKSTTETGFTTIATAKIASSPLNDLPIKEFKTAGFTTQSILNKNRNIKVPVLKKQPVSGIKEDLQLPLKTAIAASFNEQQAVIMAMPVSISEAAEIKEITLREENSATGIAVTKVYKLIQVEGEWKSTLLWTITERKPIADSSIKQADTIRYYNRVQ